MAEKKSFYENVYTKQVEELVSNQKNYDDKKEEAKVKAQIEGKRQKGLLRILYLLGALIVTLGAYKLLKIDPSSAPIITGFLVLVAGVYLFVRWINK